MIPTSRVILDSISPEGIRLHTALCAYPKFVHAEHCRHRSFSFSVSSSRAIPVAKNLEIVRDPELRAQPVHWGAEQKGMSSGEELSKEVSYGRVLSPYQTAQRYWDIAAIQAVSIAEDMVELGIHKSIVNRVIEPFLPVNVLVTGTTEGWMNFFGLRLDKVAQPEIRALAEAQWRGWNESTPVPLLHGEWHLPFIDKRVDEREVIKCVISDSQRFEKRRTSVKFPDLVNNVLQQISVARCARLSYMSFETQKRPTVEEDLKLYDRLVGSQPIHASPAEHQATPDELTTHKKHGAAVGWLQSHLHGNLTGWVQLRKLIPGERVAPLPEEYVSGV